MARSLLLLESSVTAIALVCVGACGDVEPGDPYATTASMTMTTTAGGTGSATGEDTGGSEATGSASLTDATTATVTTGADTSGADTTADDTGGCTPGAEGCPCAAGGACDPGLACLSEVCVDPGPICPIGTVGCPCTQGGTCDPDLTCVSMVCVAG